MQEQNAAIGVAIGGYYPDISLSGAFGYIGDPFIQQIAGANPVWSYGAVARADAVQRRADRRAGRGGARAYDSSVATYRQTVLTAFQQVEDNLVAIRVLGQEVKVRIEAVKSAEQAVQIAINEYQRRHAEFHHRRHRRGDRALRRYRCSTTRRSA